jgi:hypothetical protein
MKATATAGPPDGYKRAEDERATHYADMAEAESAAAQLPKPAADFASYVIMQELKENYPLLRGTVGDPLHHPNDDLHKREELDDERERRSYLKMRGKKRPRHRAEAVRESAPQGVLRGAQETHCSEAAATAARKVRVSIRFRPKSASEMLDTSTPHHWRACTRLTL